ncbi:MAG: FAD-dependent oxidoreductase [Gammaproteobacteria bacterium]|nr:FAD-dependent oxidoreductase [Gammaproteobacteria bacterium]
MPEIFRNNPATISKYEGEKDAKKNFQKLARKITDNVKVKLGGCPTTSPEYWGMREVLSDDEVNVLLTLKQRKWYTFEQMFERAKKCMEGDAARFQRTINDLCHHGILEYDYGDHYDDNGPVKEFFDEPDHLHMSDEMKAKTKRYRLSFYVPGSAELFNSSVDRIEKNPPVASFFERMTFLPLEDITPMVAPGGMGIGMHVIPVEKEVEMNKESVKLEKISYWLQKYEGHLSAGICSCRASRAMLGEGCADDCNDWCIQVGDMADYTVETGRAHYISKEKALEILKKAEANGYVHQITNIDGEDHIFDICNCNVEICNALRTALLYNTPHLSRSSFTAKVEKDKCVACGRCVEVCPAGAVKLGQKLCKADGSDVEYPKAPLPDKIRWGKYAWDENYRDTARYNTYKTGTAPCKTACPAHVPVQGYLKMAAQGRYREALALIKRENPFPAVCGRVCNKRCEDACTRGTIDKAVSIDAVKKFLADLEMKAENRYVPEKVISKVEGEWDEKIAIIGAGPAGLSCAYYLAQMGYHPTVFEKNKRPGGMMTYGIPTYKLEKDVIDAEIEIIKELGAEIKCGVEVGKDITISELKKQGYKAFYIAIGCQGGRRPNVLNDEAEGTDIAVHFLHEAFENQKQTIDGDAVIIGGGNVAIDCARTAHRFNAKSVKMFCLEDKEHMPATKEEIREAEEEGIEINPQWGPKEVKVDEAGHVTGIILKRCTSTIDPVTKKFNPQYDESETIEVKADKIVFAIGQAIEWGNLLDGTKVTFWHGNYPIADKFTYQTADEDIFVGGDVYTGPKFVIDAIAQGHEAAESLNRHVQPNAHMTIGRDRRYFKELDKADIKVDSYDQSERQDALMNEKIDYKNSFKDAHLTLTEEQVKTETARCLSCGASVVDPNKCIGCGLCTTRCEFDAIHLHRDHPEMTDMRMAEDKVTGLLKYALKRSLRIVFNSGSKEAKIMRRKRREWKKNTKEFRKEFPHTGNSVEYDA